MKKQFPKAPFNNFLTHFIGFEDVGFGFFEIVVRVDAYFEVADAMMTDV